jgi:hypothetical protein
VAVLFKKLFGLSDPELARVQDNVDDALRRLQFGQGMVLSNVNISSAAFNDAEGDPKDVVATTAERADGTSTFASRRDHKHYHGALTVADPLHPLAAYTVETAYTGETTSGWSGTTNQIGLYMTCSMTGYPGNPNLYVPALVGSSVVRFGSADAVYYPNGRLKVIPSIATDGYGGFYWTNPGIYVDGTVHPAGPISLGTTLGAVLGNGNVASFWMNLTSSTGVCTYGGSYTGTWSGGGGGSFSGTLYFSAGSGFNLSNLGAKVEGGYCYVGGTPWDMTAHSVASGTQYGFPTCAFFASGITPAMGAQLIAGTYPHVVTSYNGFVTGSDKYKLDGMAAPGVSTTTGSTSVASTTDLMLVQGNTGAVTLTLPAANAVVSGRRIVIKDGGLAATYNITITAAGTDTIDGAASQVLATSYGSVTVVSDGSSKWYLL